MPTWSSQDLRNYEQRRNRISNDRGARTAPIVEPTPVDDALGEAPLQKTNESRFRVCLCSVRKRLLDEDNLAEKFIVDQLRYAALIPDDCPETCQIDVSQRLCHAGEPEHVTITIYRTKRHEANESIPCDRPVAPIG